MQTIMPYVACRMLNSFFCMKKYLLKLYQGSIESFCQPQIWIVESQKRVKFSHIRLQIKWNIEVSVKSDPRLAQITNIYPRYDLQ